MDSFELILGLLLVLLGGLILSFSLSNIKEYKSKYGGRIKIIIASFFFIIGGILLIIKGL